MKTAYGKTLAIDFDGVLSAYTGWKGPDVLDPPLPGAIEFLSDCLDQGFSVVIFTTRPPELIGDWLLAYAPPEVTECVKVTNIKPPAWLYIDDRCMLFSGSFPSMQTLIDFKVYWDKREPELPANDNHIDE